jgi:hypothetical protein
MAKKKISGGDPERQTIFTITSPDGDPEQHRNIMRLWGLAGKERQRSENRRRAIKKSRPYKEKQQRAKENRSKALKLANSLQQNPAGISLTQRVRNKWGKTPHPFVKSSAILKKILRHSITVCRFR